MKREVERVYCLQKVERITNLWRNELSDKNYVNVIDGARRLEKIM